MGHPRIPSAAIVLTLLAAPACKHESPDTRPVERAVIDVPREPTQGGTAPRAITPVRPAGTASTDLAHEVADILNAFSKQTSCQDFDYFPDGGYQNFWCHRPERLTIRAIEARAGVPIFLSGPHPPGDFTNKSKTDFGHYNPAFVRWFATEVAPSGKDSPTVAATQGMYDAMNANGVDATKFIKALRARDEGDPTNNCPAHAAKDTDGDGIKDTFTAVVVGTPVCFEIIPAVNTTVPPTKVPQFYKANINVVGVQGNVQLDNREVLFLVPPTTPGVN